jgi:hypothetical protein
MQFAISYNPIFKALATITGTGPGQSGVTVEADRIGVRMGWAFRASIPRASVRQVEQVDRIPPLYGFGVHGWNGRWAVNGSQRGAVKLTIDPPADARVLFVPVRLRELFHSLEEPEAFVVTAGRSGTSDFA